MCKETLSATVALAIWLMAAVAVGYAQTGNEASLFRRSPAYSQNLLPVDLEPCSIGRC